MLFIKVKTANGPRTAIEIFISAPESEIRPPLRQPVRNHPNRVRQVETDKDAAFMGGFNQAGQVQQLPAPVERRWQDRYLHLIGHVIDDDFFLQSQAVLARHRD